MTFGLASDNKIMADVTQTGRNTTILTGMDTDVCVAHSAIGLLQKGFSVAVVDDATGCPGTAHQYGIERINKAGGLIVSVRCLYYEWLRTVKNSQDFRKNNSEILNSLEGIIL